ncbi:MAG: formyl transferase, partial [Actinomycetota bacterium]|nr:formyl transferase [Actinomycetota bacterium]
MLLVGEGHSSNAVYHALVREFGPLTVIQEPDLSWWFLVRRRLRRLGYREVAGQVLFSALVVPVLRLKAKARIESIIEREGMDVTPIDGPVLDVASVNSEEVRSALRRADPAVVVVNGTRIIAKDVLGCVAAPFVNL